MTAQRNRGARVIGRCKVQEKILRITAALVIAGGVLATRDSVAQTASGMQHEDSGSHPGHYTDGASDGAFHRSFKDAKKWAKEFDDPERDTWQKPEEILDALHLKRTSLVADIGAGTGYFSVRIAKRIPEGKVFAADVEGDMVRYLGERARHNHLTNLVPVQASADTPNLPEPVDVALVVDTYHHIGNRREYFAKLKSSLRPHGRLAIVDFRADSPNGPPPQYRLSAETVTQELNAAGYSLIETVQFLPRQYFLIFEKRNS
jgi:SAM-dependent methyltransferase